MIQLSNMKSILQLCLALILLSGCKPQKATYLTIDIKESDERYPAGLCTNMEHFNVLKQKLAGKRFSIDVKDDYAIMVDLEEKEEIILAKDKDDEGEFYSCDKSKGTGKETFNLELRKDGSSKFIFIIEVLVSHDPRQVRFIPVQIGGQVRSQECAARAICYLSEID